MRRHLGSVFRIPLWVLLPLVFAPSGAFAAGFGTPTMDGLLAGDESIYGLAEATDVIDSTGANAHVNLGELYVANDNDFWYFLFTINGDIGATNWGKYLLYIDTTNDASGGTVDAWGRSITISDPHKAEYTLRGWVDGGGPYGPTKTQFWAWDGLVWNEDGDADDAALSAGATSGIEWKIARSRLGDPSTIWCEVVTTCGTDADTGLDTANDPADDWNGSACNGDPATVANSTEVAVSSGSDTTPPVVTGGCVDPTFDTDILVTFNEPVDPTTSQVTGNYTVTGGKTVLAAVLDNPTTVRLILNSAYGFGACQQVRVTGVKDVAGNTIVDNGTTNIANFYRFQIYMKGRMNAHMREHDVPPHQFAWEGSVSPLTWEPLCDFLMVDGDGDSTYTATASFCLPCTTASSGTQDQEVQYKFTHQCDEWESLAGNHFYTIDVDSQPDGVDTLDIWWNDEAPVDFTTVDIDVVFRVQSPATDPPFGSTDSLGLNGSEQPLNWDVPPMNLMLDDGVAPDETGDDGVFTTRLTFPTGSLKNVEFKYLHLALADTMFAYECADTTDPSMDNRSVFLNDSLFSTTEPIVMDVAYYDDCGSATGAGEIGVAARDIRLEPGRPNPARASTVISYVIAERTHVTLEVYDVQGRLVRRLVDEIRPEGRHNVVWNGRTAEGRLLPSGIYFTRFSAAGHRESGKITLMR